LAQSAAERVGPITHGAADRLAPLANSAADRIAPFATSAVDRVSPYAQQAAGRVSPYAHQAADRIAPLATSARQSGARAAHGAVEKIGPVLDDAFERVSPAVEAARSKMSEEILPMLSEKLSAAAGSPVVEEAKKRGKAAVAAAKGELELPKEKKKGRWLIGFAIFATLAGAAVIVVRKFLGSRDADWQAARPTTPYAPAKPTETADTTGAAATAPVVDAMDDAGDDPQGGMSAHLLNLEADGAAVPDQPAEGRDMDETLETTTLGESLPETTTADETPVETTVSEEASGETADASEAPAAPVAVGDEAPTLLGEATAAPEATKSKYEGEGVYIGSEPPEGFTIKGNERSMKYHVPESAGYGRTVAEVWFNSEEAAQQAGFVRAQR
jgi:hypothetical protein